MEISIKGYITSKASERFYDCADRYAFDKTQNKFAISDGVSKSFFPKVWAEVLVNKWVSSKEFDEASFIKSCQDDWLQQVTKIVNKSDSKWFTKNAFNRKESGLATFVGLRFYKKRKNWFWRANALGDSFVFFVPKKGKNFSKGYIALPSKKEPILFDNFPDYLSSIGTKHKGEKQFKESPLTFGTFYLMTDALAEWFINEKEKAINKIQIWKDQTDFERFVDEERLNEKLGNDDSAILIITIKDDNKENITYSSEEVTIINDLIKVQQEEIEKAEKHKAQNASLKKASEETKHEEPLKNELIKDAKEENLIKGILEKGKELIFGQKEREQPIQKEKQGIDEKIEVLEEKESLSEDKEDNIELAKQTQDSEQKSKQEPESIIIKPNKPSQNITDKF